MACFIQLHLAKVKSVGNGVSNKDLVYGLYRAMFARRHTTLSRLVYSVLGLALNSSSHDFITRSCFCLFGFSLSLGISSLNGRGRGLALILSSVSYAMG